MKKSTYIIALILIFGSINIIKSQIIEKDSYPITWHMIRDNPKSMKIDACYTIDQSWFWNDELNETLIFDLATDYHRFLTFHFNNSRIPHPILQRLNIYTTDGKSAYVSVTDSVKKVMTPAFIEKSSKVSTEYFISSKGHELGESEKKGIDLYGKPDFVDEMNHYRILKWEYDGDPKYLEREAMDGKYALDSFGYSITMIYENGKLVGRIIFDDIP